MFQYAYAEIHFDLLFKDTIIMQQKSVVKIGANAITTVTV